MKGIAEVRQIIRIAILTEAWTDAPDWLLNGIFERWNQLDPPTAMTPRRLGKEQRTA